MVGFTAKTYNAGLNIFRAAIYFLIAGIDNCPVIGGLVFKYICFGLKILFKISVVVEMIRSNVQENGYVRPETICGLELEAACFKDYIIVFVCIFYYADKRCSDIPTGKNIKSAFSQNFRNQGCSSCFTV